MGFREKKPIFCMNMFRRTEETSLEHRYNMEHPTAQLAPDVLNDITNRISVLCEQEGIVLIEIALHGSRERRIVEIFVDKPEGITLDECGTVSEKISEFLETANVFPAAYRLDVSSPGISRPLQFRWQYERNIGRLLSVELASGELCKGRIRALQDDVVVLDAPKKRNAKSMFISVASTSIAETTSARRLKEDVPPKFPREIALAEIQRAIVEAEM
jgi:ribosome maturation factor RimP